MGLPDLYISINMHLVLSKPLSDKILQAYNQT
jgi:hypothetical protein